MRARWRGDLADLHLPDEAVLDQIGVLDDRLRDHRPPEVPHDLPDVEHDEARVVRGEPDGLDQRIDEAPLPGPVPANLFVSVHVPALHPVRPLDVGMHGGQRGVHLSRIERAVGLSEQRLNHVRSSLCPIALCCIGLCRTGVSGNGISGLGMSSCGVSRIALPSIGVLSIGSPSIERRIESNNTTGGGRGPPPSERLRDFQRGALDSSRWHE